MHECELCMVAICDVHAVVGIRKTVNANTAVPQDGYNLAWIVVLVGQQEPVHGLGLGRYWYPVVAFAVLGGARGQDGCANMGSLFAQRAGFGVVYCVARAQPRQVAGRVMVKFWPKVHNIPR